MSKAFLAPPSISRILSKNRNSCISSQQSIIPTLRNSILSPKNKNDSSEYTFQPKINSSNKARRSLEKFIQDQEKYQCEKERKLTELKQEITRWQDQQLKSIPQINPVSKQKLNTNENNCSVFERLSRSKIGKLVTTQSESFSPNILPRSKQISRDKAVSNLLYEDALRRQSKDKVIKESEERKIIALSNPKISPNTNGLVRKKIFSEFMYLINDSIINPLLALSVIEEIFNVKLRQINSPYVRRIIEIVASDRNEVSTEKLWNFIDLVIGNSSSYFNRSIETEIKEKYHCFYQERLNREKKIKTQQLPSFHPKTLSNSEELAVKYRAKKCEKVAQFIETENVNVRIQNQTLTLEDLFIIDQMQRRKENQQRKKQKENLQLSQCTFKPNISPIKQSKKKIVLKNLMKEKEKQQQTHDIRQSTDRVETKETPKIKHSVKKSLDQIQKVHISTQKKAVLLQRNRRSVDNLEVRLLMGRTQRDFQKKMTGRGYPQGENYTQSTRQKHKQISENLQKIKGLKQL